MDDVLAHDETGCFYPWVEGSGGGGGGGDAVVCAGHPGLLPLTLQRLDPHVVIAEDGQLRQFVQRLIALCGD
jgi:hypothetical protein